MRLDKFVISILIFSLMVMSSLLIIADINTNYADAGVNISTEKFGNVSIYNLSSDFNDMGQNLKDKTIDGKEIDESDAVDSLFTGAYSAIKLVVSSIEMVMDLFTAIAMEIGLSEGAASLLSGFLLAALMIIIVFSIIYLIFRIGT